MKLKVKTHNRSHAGKHVKMSAAAENLAATDTRRCSSAAAPLEFLVPPSAPEKHLVHWFRKGLRLHDNPALREGLCNATTFRCIFIIDPWFANSSNVGINKWRFLLQCLDDLDKSLRMLNSRLFVVRGQPADALPKLFKEWGTTMLTFEEDPEPYGRIRDHNIMSKCREKGISVVSRVSHTLYTLDKIIELNGGRAPLTYHQFQAIVASMPPPPAPEPTISPQTLGDAVTPLGHDHNERFGVPTLEELGFDTENLRPPVWIGGESEALARLERHLERKAWVASFGRPKMNAQSLLASKTGVSPYLRFGCLSTRLFYYQLTELYQRVIGEQPPLSLHGQILWREFFYCAATRNPNFDRMEGNPICVQIPWTKNKDILLKWANAATGFPWIDAIMVQLREEGWIHHLARHAVACFLTRGDLWISWEEGMKVFDEMLLDADWSVNAGTWMWLSCSSFFQQFFHCYCPVRFGRKTDPNGDYIRRYVPVLRDMPSRYIHEPWMAPLAVQEAARCVVGRDYPRPMVNHSEASTVNIARIKQVYAILTKFKPHNGGGGALNPQYVLRPSVAQSSPSPNAIISSINHSNLLCSESAEPAGGAQEEAQHTPYVSKRPLKHAHRQDIRPTPFKEIVIIQQPHDSNVSLGNISDPQQKQFYETILPPPQKQDKYDFKNLATHNNYVPCANSREMVQSPQIFNEVYQQAVKIKHCDLQKSKYHLPTGAPMHRKDGARTPRHNASAQLASDNNYNQERHFEYTKEQNEDRYAYHPCYTDAPYNVVSKNNQSNQ